MHTAVVVLIGFAAIDLVLGGAVLALVWVEHQRQRRFARASGLPVPAPATGQFLALAGFGLIAIVSLYAAFAFFLAE